MKKFEKLINFSSLHDTDKVDIILVSLGKKSAAIGEFWYGPKENFSNTQFQDNLNELESIFKELGLNHFLNRARESYPHFYVAQDKKYLDAIIDACALEDTKATGRALGYPKTAINAFIGKTYLKEPPEEIKNDEAIRFLNFRLSSDHWREEYELARERARIIKEFLPEFHKKIVSE